MQLSKQLEAFQGNLEDFAAKHKDEIRRNPQFRVQFQEMCASIGVDPLACKCEFNCISYLNQLFAVDSVQFFLYVSFSHSNLKNYDMKIPVYVGMCV